MKVSACLVWMVMVTVVMMGHHVIAGDSIESSTTTSLEQPTMTVVVSPAYPTTANTFTPTPTTTAPVTTTASTEQALVSHPSTEQTAPITSTIAIASVTQPTQPVNATTVQSDVKNDTDAENLATQSHSSSRHPITRAIWFLVLVTVLPCLCLCGLIMGACYCMESGVGYFGDMLGGGAKV